MLVPFQRNGTSALTTHPGLPAAPQPPATRGPAPLPRLFPAPFALIEHWRRHGGERQARLSGEAWGIADLLLGDMAHNLIRVFQLQQRLKDLGRSEATAPEAVHVIGAGVMGGGIAAWCALKGLRVTLQDARVEQTGGAIQGANALFRKRLRAPRHVQAAQDRLTPDPKGYGLVRAELVIEAIVDNAEAKRGLLGEIEPRLRPEALIANNASAIPLEELAQTLSHPDRLPGLALLQSGGKRASTATRGHGS